jgi:hypothetical protein
LYDRCVASWQEIGDSAPAFAAARPAARSTLRPPQRSVDPPDWEGDAKLSGRAEEITDSDRRLAIFRSQGSDPPSSEAHLFRGEIDQASLVGLNEARDRLVIELWRPGRELRRFERE